ncbi:hypothetical protein HN51_036796, partial [Arachis hypogaea]
MASSLMFQFQFHFSIHQFFDLIFVTAGDTSFGVVHDTLNTFFSETRSDKHIPHDVFVDLEPT